MKQSSSSQQAHGARGDLWTGLLVVEGISPVKQSLLHLRSSFNGKTSAFQAVDCGFDSRRPFEEDKCAEKQEPVNAGAITARRTVTARTAAADVTWDVSRGHKKQALVAQRQSRRLLTVESGFRNSPGVRSHKASFSQLKGMACWSCCSISHPVPRD